MFRNRAASLVGNLVVVLVEIFLRCLPNRRTNAGLARVGGYRDQHLTHVIGVIRLRKLMANLVSVGIDFLQETAWLIRRRRIRRVYRDANDVVPRWHNGLAVAAVKNKILPAPEEAVGVRPAMADALIAGDSNSATVPELRTARRLGSIGCGHRISIQHAETLLGRLPDKARCG